MSRRHAREIVLCLVFEKNYHADITHEQLFNGIIENNEIDNIYNSIRTLDESKQKNLDLDENDIKYMKQVFFGVFENLERIDDLISESTIGWTKNRISKVSMSILRICVCEILFADDVPLNIAVNEAVELSKKYDHSEAHTFINGVLRAVAKNIGEAV